MNKFDYGETVYIKGNISFDINNIDFLQGFIYDIHPDRERMYHIMVDSSDTIFVRGKNEVFKTKKELTESYINDIENAIKVKQIEIKNYKKMISKLKKEIS